MTNTIVKSGSGRSANTGTASPIIVRATASENAPTRTKSFISASPQPRGLAWTIHRSRSTTVVFRSTSSLRMLPTVEKQIRLSSPGPGTCRGPKPRLPLRTPRNQQGQPIRRKDLVDLILPAGPVSDPGDHLCVHAALLDDWRTSRSRSPGMSMSHSSSTLRAAGLDLDLDHPSDVRLSALGTSSSGSEIVGGRYFRSGRFQERRRGSNSLRGMRRIVAPSK